MTNQIMPSLGDVIEQIERFYDPQWARDWDAVGLVVGDTSAPVRRVLFAVDITMPVVEEALAWRADLIVSHHPLFLRPVHSVSTTTAKGRIVHQLMRIGCALYTAHTNADAAVPGVSDALARMVGLTDLEPLEVVPGDESGRGIGRIGRLEKPMLLRDFAQVVAEALPGTVQGVRVAGDAAAMVQRIAVCGGSGDGLLELVRQKDVDVYLTADLRHHPVSDARETVNEGTPYLIDVAHWASEWPWLAGAANRLTGVFDDRGTPIEARVSVRCTDPWIFRVPSPGGIVR